MQDLNKHFLKNDWLYHLEKLINKKYFYQWKQFIPNYFCRWWKCFSLIHFCKWYKILIFLSFLWNKHATIMGIKFSIGNLKKFIGYIEKHNMHFGESPCLQPHKILSHQKTPPKQSKELPTCLQPHISHRHARIPND